MKRTDVDPRARFTWEFEALNEPLKIKKAPHPAKYSNELLPILAKYAYGDILDIMGGTGKAGLLKKFNANIKSVTINEIEREWSEQAYHYGVDTVITGDARYLHGIYDCVVTSPPYGNRMADNFKAGKTDPRRKRYVGDLGRQVSDGSVSCKHFGKGYEKQMALILDAVIVNIIFERFVLNISNFIRQFKEIDVVSWYKNYFKAKSFTLTSEEKVITRRQKGVGANTSLRVPCEYILVFDRQGKQSERIDHEKLREFLTNYYRKVNSGILRNVRRHGATRRSEPTQEI